MTLAEAIAEVKALADPKVVAIWNNYGVHPKEEFIGAGHTKLKALAKKIKKNHTLALELWNSNLHDARLLATLIEDPRQVTEQQLTEQVTQINTPDLAQKFTTHVATLTPFAQALASQWTQRTEEHVKQCGFLLVAELAAKNQTISNVFFSFYLSQIAREAKQQRNWVLEAMNYALIAIGKRNEALQAEALRTSLATGRLIIDYGTSSCKAPDAEAELLKVGASQPQKL